MRICVTGGAGNIGSVLVKKLLEDDDNFIVVADNLSTGRISKLPPLTSNWRFLRCDVNDTTDVADFDSFCKFDYIFHFAAVVGVERTQKNPVSVLRDIDGIKNILDMAKNTGVKRVFFSSSSEIYGEPVFIPQNEDKTPLNSRLPYAVVKNVGESFCRSYHQEYGLSYTIFRFFNTYSYSQTTDFVIPKFIKKALRNEDIPIYGDGLQTRTFLYVDDTVDVCLGCLYDGKMKNDVLNVGSDKMFTILDVAKLVIKLCNSKSKIMFLPPLKEGDMTRRQPDNTKMKQVLGRELLSLEDGIKKMITEYEKN